MTRYPSVPTLLALACALAAPALALESSNCFDRSAGRSDCFDAAPVRVAMADFSARTSQASAAAAPTRSSIAAAPAAPSAPSSPSAAEEPKEKGFLQRFTEGPWTQPAIGGVIGGLIIGGIYWATVGGFALTTAALLPALGWAVGAAIVLTLLFKYFQGK
ncbi:MAG: hypothetical protein HY078_11915 [Elusimicrobia bacterium]|nr:hypothetical protein [Elusimicrobiota bacterium]